LRRSRKKLSASASDRGGNSSEFGRSLRALTGSAGTKTVFAEFKDRAGNVSAIAKDTITFRP
jgi:hypothetical protein